MSTPVIKESQINRIMRKTGKKITQCKCNKCKKQCVAPCLGTPQDIEKIIDAGYGEKLSPTLWTAGIMMGVTSSPIAMVQATKTESGCIFFHDGLCDLHGSGLKPTEGKLAHHSIVLENWKPSKSIAWNVAKEWLMDENADVIERIIKKLNMNQ